ncbi:hypothetical protein C2G38_2212006 [Gigaspora rosea]|uniref:Uncharacterized protein n=1 Tax=Gigaspora rosea TaxID=44941 RepID=A0A397UFB3_9GLOM|nr:hypothetical protein C2G38_2212006 [Gigaspora rosea]
MLAFLKEYLNESLISKNFIHSFTAIIREKTEISKGLCAISNDKKYQYPSNKQYTLNKIPGSKKSQNKRRLKLEEEMKPYLHEFKVEKKKQSLKIKHLKETRFNLRQQENIMDFTDSSFAEFVTAESVSVPNIETYDPSQKSRNNDPELPPTTCMNDGHAFL